MIKLEGFRAGLDRGAPRAVEAAWIVCKVLFFLPPWPMPSALRRWLLRGFGGVVGAGVVIRSGVDVTFPWRLTVGDHAWLGEGVKILNLAHVEIGSNACVSQQAFLCTGSHDFRRDTFDLIAEPIVVGASSWLAAGCFVGPGVHVGADSMVCALTVVTADVPESSMVRGNPAVVRPRSDRASADAAEPARCEVRTP